VLTGDSPHPFGTSGTSRNAVTVTDVYYSGAGLARIWTFSDPWTFWDGEIVLELQINRTQAGWQSPWVTTNPHSNNLTCWYPYSGGPAYEWRIIAHPPNLTWLPRYLTIPQQGMIRQ